MMIRRPQKKTKQIKRRKWYVLHIPGGCSGQRLTKIQTKLLKSGEELRSPYYMIQKKHIRVKKFVLPGYVFIKFDYSRSRELEFIRKLTGARFVEQNNSDKPLTLTYKDYKEIEKKGLSHAPTEIQTVNNLRKGDLITIASGPFSKHEAIVVKFTTEHIYCAIHFNGRFIELPIFKTEVNTQ